MREIDRLATEDYGIPSILLMENAGLQVVDAALTLLGEAGSRITIICGIGNNGGDGLVATRHLCNSGYQVTCLLIGEPSRLRGDTLTNYIILERIGQKPIAITEEMELQLVAEKILDSHLIVDALYGTGFSGELTGISGQVVKLINRASAKVLAIDIPSGLEANNGRAKELAVQADWTVTMALPKLGLLMPAAAPYVGRLTVADISIPLPLIHASQLKVNLITSDQVRQCLPSRALDSHKGDYGRVLVVGGCPDMTGAIVMASQGAMKMGTGLLTAALPEPARALVAVQLPQATTMALPATKEGQIAETALTPLLAALQQATAGVIGPGMSRYKLGEELVTQIIRHTPVPLVLDADALNLLADNLKVLKAASAPLILTPHPGEMARLTGQSVSAIEEQRIESACNFASEHGVVLVLKGSRTVVATPDGEVFINTTGNPGMACGGSGDVLAGMIAGLLAQGLPVATAAWAAVHIHGRAGDLAAEELGQRSMSALDLIQALPQVFKEWSV